MKALYTLSAIIITFLSLITFTGCEESNLLDTQIYCKPEIGYTLNNNKDSFTASLSDITGTSLLSQNYDKIQITTYKSWTYGLVLEKIEFDVILSDSTNVDIDVTISNLEHGENHNSTTDTYFFQKTISLNKDSTHVSLIVNDNFVNKDAVISIEVVESCYSANPDLKLSIGNFKMFGEHEQTNY